MLMNLFAYKDPMLNLSHNRDEKFPPYPMHTHSFLEIFCLLDGEVTFHIEGTHYHLKQGYMLLMRPGEAHYVEVDPRFSYERIVLSFDAGLLETLEPGNMLLQPFYDRKAGRRNLYHPDQACTDYLMAMTEPDGSRATILSNLVLLMQRLCRRFAQTAGQVQTPDSVEQKIIRYINQNINDVLSVESLCERFYLSRPQLSRRFREATGTSIGRYIAAKRMVLAQQLLLQGKKPTEVFTQCGYRDYATFFRAYKAYFGHSPRETTRLRMGAEQRVIE